MQIDASHARQMLAAMDYDCEMLDYLAELPDSAIKAVYSAWRSLQHGNLQSWEIDLITARMLEALARAAKDGGEAAYLKTPSRITQKLTVTT